MIAAKVEKGESSKLEDRSPSRLVPHGPQLLQDVWFLEKLAHFVPEVIRMFDEEVEKAMGWRRF